MVFCSYITGYINVVNSLIIDSNSYWYFGKLLCKILYSDLKKFILIN